MTLPEGRKPLRWQDMPLPDRPKGHPSTERLEIEKLQARVAELEAALRRIADGRFSLAPAPDYVTEPHKSPKEIARAALKGESDE